MRRVVADTQVDIWSIFDVMWLGDRQVIFLLNKDYFKIFSNFFSQYTKKL